MKIDNKAKKPGRSPGDSGGQKGVGPAAWGGTAGGDGPEQLMASVALLPPRCPKLSPPSLRS